MTKEVERRLHGMQIRMARCTLRISLLNHVTNEAIRQQLGIAPIEMKMRESCLRWFGPVNRAAPNTVTSIAYHLESKGQAAARKA